MINLEYKESLNCVGKFEVRLPAFSQYEFKRLVATGIATPTAVIVTHDELIDLMFHKRNGKDLFIVKKKELDSDC